MVKKRKPIKDIIESDQQFHVRMMTAYLQRGLRMKEMIKQLFRDPINKKTR